MMIDEDVWTRIYPEDIIICFRPTAEAGALATDGTVGANAQASIAKELFATLIHIPCY